MLSGISGSARGPGAKGREESRRVMNERGPPTALRPGEGGAIGIPKTRVGDAFTRLKKPLGASTHNSGLAGPGPEREHARARALRQGSSLRYASLKYRNNEPGRCLLNMTKTPGAGMPHARPAGVRASPADRPRPSTLDSTWCRLVRRASAYEQPVGEIASAIDNETLKACEAAARREGRAAPGNKSLPARCRCYLVSVKDVRRRAPRAKRDLSAARRSGRTRLRLE
ncbi:hypothetical protein EVAR_79357_1 [Eumeta japonica]|uniref:Uncharacterized protein n=1 Tax=Eumeta variegata TaxID=151549 RepID=A0A4C1TFP2_EUMVA|nr:hypothetical protein EVAR_79357_1 [Eumeta japonica]